jgi:hypothetical protein
VAPSAPVQMYPVSDCASSTASISSMVFPSSQPSVLFLFPSPQTFKVHVEVAPSAPVQMYPVSTVQVAASITSIGISVIAALGTFLVPSPQTFKVHVEVAPSAPVQMYPVSTVQVALHPSPALVFPSSQPYELTLFHPHKLTLAIIFSYLFLLFIFIFFSLFYYSIFLLLFFPFSSFITTLNFHLIHS